MAQWDSRAACRKGQSQDIVPGGRVQRRPNLWPPLAPGSALGPHGAHVAMGAAAEGHWEWLQAPQQRPSLRSGALCSERTFFPHPCCPFPQPVPSQPPTACIQCLTTVHVPPVSPNFTAPLLLLRPLLFLSSLPHLSSQGEHHWTGGVCAAWAPARPALLVLTTGSLGAGTVTSWSPSVSA